ncbi:hypothetical protein [Micromonospora eburnea]|uniref:Uncharacterized protein n=1 Tax=Micromonospora eburnea TaxID=227316 RepID=A0A1C6UB12_9ACTN|nr:hypothetical protein [Micromonospora eburnea]SCL51280.1 hypothetical protein GA0070604_2322 [Micromonospora eburnea]
MDSDSEVENLSPEEQKVQARLLRAREKVSTVSMALSHVEHLLNPANPYTPAANTPSVMALLTEVNPGRTPEEQRDAMLKLQEKLTVADKEYKAAMKEAEKFSSSS